MSLNKKNPNPTKAESLSGFYRPKISDYNLYHQLQATHPHPLPINYPICAFRSKCRNNEEMKSDYGQFKVCCPKDTNAAKQPTEQDFLT